MERRLAAILAADMVGYSRLMGADEAGTLAAYHRHRRDLINPRATQYHGRICKLTGDGVLMEFASVVDAVRFAVEVQLALRDENANRPLEKQFRYRIGINIGDIVIEEEDIYGDGVNIAARLQELADPGGICLAGTAFDQIKGKLGLTAEYLGEKQVKNIAEPVKAYRILLDDKAKALATPLVQDMPAARRAGASWRPPPPSCCSSWRAARSGGGPGRRRPNRPRSSASRIPCRTNPRSRCCPSSTSAAMWSTTISQTV